MRVYPARGPSFRNYTRDVLLNFKQEYIAKMIETFKLAEDLESVENLHALCSLMQTIRAFIYRP